MENINQEFIEVQNNLIDIMFDLSNQMNDAKDYDKIDADMETLDKLSTIVKRLGDSIILSIPNQENKTNEGEINNVN